MSDAADTFMTSRELEQRCQNANGNDKHAADLDGQSVFELAKIDLGGNLRLKGFRKRVGYAFGLLRRKMGLVPQRPGKLKRIEWHRAHAPVVSVNQDKFQRNSPLVSYGLSTD